MAVSASRAVRSYHVALCASILPLGLSLAAPISAQAISERHRFPISIANAPPADALRDGPNFRSLDAITVSTLRQGGKSFSEYLTADATLVVAPDKTKITDRDKIDAFMKVIGRHCQGPYAIDEGNAWVQTSWVCHVGNNEPVRSYFPFKFSPEVSLEFGLVDGKVNKIVAMEIVPTPLNPRHLAMDAAEHVADQR